MALMNAHREVNGFCARPKRSARFTSIVFAVAAYFVFSQVGLVGTIAGLVLAHSVLAFPFVVVLVSSALSGFDRSLEEASRSLGAGPVKTFFRVTFPQIRLAVFGA